MVPSAPADSISKTIDKGANWSTVTDRNNWYPTGISHDRTNNFLRIICNFPGTGDRFEYVTIDLSDDTVVQVLTLEVLGSETLLSYDCFMVGAKVYALCRHKTGLAVDSIYIYEITSSPAVLIDSLVYDNISDPSWVVVVGTDVYFYFFKTGDNIHLFKFDENAGTISHVKDCGVNTDSPSQSLRTIAYDGSDILYFILTESGTNYLYTYSIATTTLTKLSGYSIAIQLNRNTATGVLEKGFHLSEDKIYQIPTNYTGMLNLISTFDFTDTIIAITDRFVMCAGGEMYEYVDKIDSILEGMIFHSRNNYPYLQMKFNSDNIVFAPQQFVQIIGTYVANDSDKLFYGTYNFGDEADGTSGTAIEFVDYVSTAATTSIVAVEDGHRKVLKQTNIGGSDTFYGGITQSNECTIEFRIKPVELDKSFHVYIREDGDIMVYIAFSGTDIDYFDNLVAVEAIDSFGSQWYRFRVNVHNDDTWDLYIDGVEIATGITTYNANSMTLGINRFYGRAYDGTMYFDAIGESEDANYNVGDNQYAEEGQENQVIFEGIAEIPTEGRLQYVLVNNQGYEMDNVKPKGLKSGRSDEIISDINDDGSPNGPEYVQDGTLAEGSAMGNLQFSSDKTYRKVTNDFAEKDGFLWNLRPQGSLDYNAGDIDSLAVLRHDVTTYKDVILQVKGWKVAKLNQIIVNGSMNIGTGEPYAGIWNDTEDQQVNSVNSVTIEDSQLNSDVLCQAKADLMGATEAERLRAQFKFRKTGYGLIQPGQLITFKYDVTNYMTIPEGSYVLDKIRLNVKTEIGYAEISSGL